MNTFRSTPQLLLLQYKFSQEPQQWKTHYWGQMAFTFHQIQLSYRANVEDFARQIYIFETFQCYIFNMVWSKANCTHDLTTPSMLLIEDGNLTWNFQTLGVWNKDSKCMISGELLSPKSSKQTSTLCTYFHKLLHLLERTLVLTASTVGKRERERQSARHQANCSTSRHWH